jgi:hypothetical protein
MQEKPKQSALEMVQKIMEELSGVLQFTFLPGFLCLEVMWLKRPRLEHVALDILKINLLFYFFY